MACEYVGGKRRFLVICSRLRIDIGIYEDHDFHLLRQRDILKTSTLNNDSTSKSDSSVIRVTVRDLRGKITTVRKHDVSSFVLRGVDVTGPIRSRQSASPGVIELWMCFFLKRRQDVVGVVERVTVGKSRLCLLRCL